MLQLKCKRSLSLCSLQCFSKNKHFFVSFIVWFYSFMHIEFRSAEIKLCTVTEKNLPDTLLFNMGKNKMKVRSQNHNKPVVHSLMHGFHQCESSFRESFSLSYSLQDLFIHHIGGNRLPYFHVSFQTVWFSCVWFSFPVKYIFIYFYVFFFFFFFYGHQKT